MGIFSSFSRKWKKKSDAIGPKVLPAERAIEWLKTYRLPGAGIPPTNKVNFSAPGITGYFIQTLYNWGEKEFALELARWEASIQRPDGAFPAPNSEVPYTFDTSQVIRGFLAVVDDAPEFGQNLRRACDYVESHIAPDGQVLHDSYDTWKFSDGTSLSEYGNLYVLPPLLFAGQKLCEERYVKAARRGMDYYRQKTDLVEFKPDIGTLSHYFGYMMEALVDLGEVDLARKGLRNAVALQKSDGSIAAFPGVDWVCSTGMAQLAIALYKLGWREPADKAMAYLETLQNPSGGFYGSYGKGAKYFPKEEISWAVKFFLDGYMLKMKSDFEGAGILEVIDENDGRLKEIFSFFGNLDGKKVLDVGCGKGRYLRFLIKSFPKGQYYGLDMSEKLLDLCPREVHVTAGTMLALKYPDSYFDCVLSVEALEHAINVEVALKEMVRVLKPGGRIIIIDKNIAKLGALDIMPWERWFDADQILKILKEHHVEAVHRKITYEKYSQPDGLFIAWKGIKSA